MHIALKDVRIKAFHGVYDEERILGGDFVINLELRYLPELPIITELEDTLNYEILFQMVQLRMAQPTALLEQIVMELTAQIMEKYPQVRFCRLLIEKCNPPIEGLRGSVCVAFERSR